MLGKVEIFSTDFGHIFETASKSSAQIFNEAIIPRVNKLAEQVEPVATPQPQQQPFNPFTPQSQQEELIRPMAAPVRPQVPVVEEENYDAPVSQKATPQGDLKIKLSNYGYSDDATPDYNSNVLKIGHSNNQLESGKSAALTKSLAERYGLKTGDMFEAFTASGEVLRRRYDDTVPGSYKGRKLPETVDLYDVGGSNNFAGVVTGIRPLSP